MNRRPGLRTDAPQLGSRSRFDGAVRNADLSWEVEEALGRERRRIARDLHDALAQGLTGSSLHLEAAMTALERGDAVEARTHLARASELARTGLVEARRAVKGLRDDVARRLCLPDEILTVLESTSEVASLKTKLIVEGKLRAVPSFQANPFIRVVREALTNTIRHAGAKNFQVTLRYSDDGIEMEIEDDGVGMPTPSNFGCGILGMRERVEEAGMRFAIHSLPGRGVTISVLSR